jgi:hypothetical protein
MRLALIVAASLALPGCSSLRDQAVPGCPHCGDPETRTGPDGRGEVVPRLRLVSSSALPAGPAAAAPDAGAHAADPR